MHNSKEKPVMKIEKSGVDLSITKKLNCQLIIKLQPFANVIYK